MGVITGVAGGMIRDILSQSVPVVMRGEVYASAAIIGTVIYTVLRVFIDEVPAILVSMAIIVVIRLLTLHWNLNLPKLRFPENPS